MGTICTNRSENEAPTKNNNYNSFPERESYNIVDRNSMISNAIVGEDDNNPNAEFFEKLIITSSMAQGYMEQLSSIDNFNMIKVRICFF